MRQEDCCQLKTILSNRKFQGSLGYKSDPVSNKIKLVGIGIGIELGHRQFARHV